MIAFAVLAIFPICMIFATCYDLLTMTIPNRIVLALLIGFAILAPLTGMSVEDALWHIGTALVVLIAGYFLFEFGVMGGGDAKLLAVSALWFGWPLAIIYLAIASLMGGALTLLIISLRRYPLPESVMSVSWIARLHNKEEGIPYGAALGPAALYIFPNSRWMEYVSSVAQVG